MNTENNRLRVATYNILNTKDRWAERKNLTLDVIQSMEADLVGL